MAVHILNNPREDKNTHPTIKKVNNKACRNALLTIVEIMSSGLNLKRTKTPITHAEPKIDAIKEIKKKMNASQPARVGSTKKTTVANAIHAAIVVQSIM
ncbi:MAG: hypothetical protein ABIH21_02075 [Patescibacteria group bacterium]